MDFEIKKCSYNDAIKANNLLTKLIVDEKKYDKNINEECVVKSLYENFFNEDDVALYVACLNNDIIGYIYGYVQNNGDAKKNIVTVLDALYVLEDFRKKSAATKLIDTFIKWSMNKNARYIELKVCDKNKEAIELYNKFNFMQKKIIMVKEIGE